MPVHGVAHDPRRLVSTRERHRRRRPGGGARFRLGHAKFPPHWRSNAFPDGGYAGIPAGILLEMGGKRLYHAGDTTVFSDMQLIRDLYAPEFGMLPIGDHFTMGPKAAALAARYLGVKEVLPIHFGTFPPLIGRPEDLEKHLGDAGIKVHKIEPGQTVR